MSNHIDQHVTYIKQVLENENWTEREISIFVLTWMGE